MTASDPKLYTPPATKEELLLKWLRRARESQFSHYDAAKKLRNHGQNLGIPVIIITAVLGASAFGSILTETVPLFAKLIAGLLGLAAAILSSLQTFFKFSERSEKHKVCAAKYGAIRRELEFFHTQGNITDAELKEIRLKLDKLAEDAPDVEAAFFSRKAEGNIE